MQKRRKKTKTLKAERPLEIIITISDFQFDVSLTQEYEADSMKQARDYLKYVTDIVNHMSKNIYIDKTYVCFKGNRWRDAFITEEGWRELIDLLQETGFGKKRDKETDYFIRCSLMTIALTYMYGVVEKFGIDLSTIDINWSDDAKFKVRYDIDNRTEWNS